MKLILFYLLWAVVPMLLLKRQLKKDGYKRDGAVFACLVFGWIVYLDYFEMKKHRPWLFRE